MLVGSTEINFGELKGFATHPDDIVAYSDSLVPLWAQHIEQLKLNQRYYLAIHLRNTLTLPYKTRMELANKLIKDINIAGVMSDFISIHEIIEACNKEELKRVLEEYLKDDNVFKKKT